MKQRKNSKISLDDISKIYSFRSQSTQLKRIYEQSSCVYPKSKTLIINQTSINMSDSKVKLNIGGIRFETFNSTLNKIPGTRLSQLSKSDQNYDVIKEEFFFDRSPILFESILNFYRTGEMHIPSSECGSSFSKVCSKYILSNL